MSETPWAPEAVVSPARAAALIEKRFPALEPVRLALLGEGWDNTAYLVNGSLVFRFPRRRIAVPLMEAESRLLPRLAPRLSVPIPHPTFVASPDATGGEDHGDAYPWPFAGYPLLSGRTACGLALTEGQRAALAEPLGRFLAELHAFPAAEARALGAGGDDLGRLDRQRIVPRLKDRLDRLQPALPDQVAAALRLVDTLLAAFPAGYAPRADTLVHGDLYARHILIDEEDGACALAGVIDWGDIHVGDRAVDLAVVWGFLPPAARDGFRRVYGQVHGEVDAVTWSLARLRALWSSTALVLYGMDVGDHDLAREGRTALEHVTA